MPQYGELDLPPGYCLREAATAEDFNSFAKLAKNYHDWLEVDLNTFQNFEGEVESLPGSYAAPLGAVLLVSVDPTADNAQQSTETRQAADSPQNDEKEYTKYTDVACAAFRPLKQHQGEKPDTRISSPSVAARVIHQSEVGEQQPGCDGPICPLNNTEVCALKRVWVEEEHQGAGLGKVLISATAALAKERGYNKMVLDTLKQLESANKVYEQMGFKQRPPFYHNPLPGAVYWEKDL